MQNISLLNNSDVCGFYELDASGGVLYSRPKRDGKFIQSDGAIVGLNFFTEVFNCQNANVLRRRFLEFVSNRRAAETFLFGGLFSDDILPLRVMFVCLSERDNGKREIRFYVDIKQG